LRELKARAQTLKPSLKLGKAGVTPEFLAAFDDALTRSHLVKIRFEEFKEERKSLARELAEKSSSRLVQQVGHTAVFYRAAAKPADPS
jgi:Predicted RNA-binding protein containing KH domain, possibly ribosomal protein